MILASVIIEQRKQRVKEAREYRERAYYTRRAYGYERGISPESQLEACHKIGVDPLVAAGFNELDLALHSWRKAAGRLNRR